MSVGAMIVVMNRLIVPGGSSGRVEVLFRERVAAMAVPGLIDFALLKDRREDVCEGGDEQYIAMMRWVDRASFEAWAASDDFAKAHGGPQSRGPVRASLEEYDLLFERAFT